MNFCFFGLYDQPFRAPQIHVDTTHRTAADVTYSGATQGPQGNVNTHRPTEADTRGGAPHQGTPRQQGGGNSARGEATPGRRRCVPGMAGALAVTHPPWEAAAPRRLPPPGGSPHTLPPEGPKPPPPWGRSPSRGAAPWAPPRGCGDAPGHPGRGVHPCGRSGGNWRGDRLWRRMGGWTWVM